jgi:hypothetical protein
MRDLDFYNVGCDEPTGARRLMVAVRRSLRRVLRPIFARQVEILHSICDRLDATEQAENALRRHVDALSQRQDDLSDQAHTAMAFGWDYTAMVRRLAALEDRVESMTTPHEESAQRPDPRQLTLPFPEREERPRALAS